MRKLLFLSAIVVLPACKHAEKCDWGYMLARDTPPSGVRHYTCQCSGTKRAPTNEETAWTGIGGSSEYIESMCEGTILAKDLPRPKWVLDGGQP